MGDHTTTGMKLAAVCTGALLMAGPAVVPAAQADEKLPRDVVSGWVFEKSLAPGFRPWGLEVVKAGNGHPVRAGEKSLRFEVRPGDCSWNTAGHSDCDTDRERHELVQTGRTQREGDTYWYAWSLFLPADFPVVHPTKVALGQFHQVPEVIWMFRNGEGGYFVNRQDELGRGYGFDRILTDRQMRGKWSDILVHAHWTHSARGFFRVWVGGRPAYAYDGPTMGSDTTVYFKFGIYRAFISRYMTAKDTGAVPRQAIYFDEVRRGLTRQDVTQDLH